MDLIADSETLNAAFYGLFNAHKDVSFAVAWASSGNDVYDLFKKHSRRIKRAVIGTHFFQTHPDVIDEFRKNENVRFVLQPDGVFHPKIYLFGNKSTRWEALIGSANLTTGALSRNSEAMLSVGHSDRGSAKTYCDIHDLINRYWDMGTKVTRQEAERYRSVWEMRQRDVRRLMGQYGRDCRLIQATSSVVMSMTWDRYFRSVKGDKAHGFEQRCQVLEAVRRAFDKYSVFEKMPDDERKFIAGLPNHWRGVKPSGLEGWFGGMRGAGYFRHSIGENNKYISQALSAVPLRGSINRRIYLEYVDLFAKALPKNVHTAVGLSSRLLAMKRPDQFVCVDKGNRQRLCKDFGIKQSGLTYERYWDEIIEPIQDSPWWNSPRPAGRWAAAVWDGRVAMLDAIFYDEQS